MRPIHSKITEIVEESPNVRTFFFDTQFDEAIPGQFVMVWVHGTDEVPMTLSGKNSITVQKVGDATSRMFELGIGDHMGLRGPFGRGFTIPRNGENVLFIAGGVGAAPIAPLADIVKMRGIEAHAILGARCCDEILFRERFACGRVDITTDDGSEGRSGFVTDQLTETDTSNINRIYVCGPEIMMYKVFEILKARNVHVKTEFSLHRYFKCGIGVCGACSMDPEGLRVCRDGPVFNGGELEGSEFGHYERDSSGRKCRF
ncbi:dihydroorotate dehydrogenase electron transfer subunit [Methanohalophilus profundi]|uniref:dihydroorotate dehydrogenase electron transfer subunit n=1 Tax=Methanohalophilus profundi TaxID=2138083 RepID=UPI00101CA014|nr:dihydroorotate dehydrogenase electron transfer subunit [Methanohalophilus profundi]